MAADDAADTSQDDAQTGNEQSSTTERDNAERDRRAGADLSVEQLQKALGKARDEAAKMRQRAKFAFDDEESFNRAKEALGELQKAEDARRSEVERLTERNEQLLYRSAESERNLMRLRVALGAGISTERADEFASRLRGDNEDDLKADAEQLRVLFQPAAPERRADPSQGKGRSSEPVSNPLQAALESKLNLTR